MGISEPQKPEEPRKRTTAETMMLVSLWIVAALFAFVGLVFLACTGACG